MSDTTIERALAREVDVPLPFDEHTEFERTRPRVTLLHGDVIETLRTLPEHSVHCVMTSPPYYGLRSYGINPRRWDDGTVCVLGDEDTVERYVQHVVAVAHEIRRVLHPRGSFWLNLGDSYAGGGRHDERKEIYAIPKTAKPSRPRQKQYTGKSLLLVPSRVALALSDEGWTLRQDNIWAKALSFLPAYSGSVMPESTRDRTTWAHEHVFHFTLTKNAFYDQDGCREPYAISSRVQARTGYTGQRTKAYASAHAQDPSDSKRRILESIKAGIGRNLRNVWVIPKQNFLGAHFATFPMKLVEPVVKLATSEKGVCEVCLEPWRRRVVREAVPAHVRAQFEAARAQTASETGRTDGHTSKRPNYRRKVLREEWEPGCNHGGNPIPATLLDPFMGSGRAGMVATRLGRSFIGIDASAEYVRMAEVAIQSGEAR